MRILFMGTPDFAQKSLEGIYNAGYNIIGVVTNPDRPKGRGMKMIASPVKEYAIEKDIPVFQPLKVKGNVEFIEQVKCMNPEVICVVAYGKILPKEILEIPEKGCINVHGSLLPKYRGAAPIQWSIINGDKITGVTTMFMDVGMDTGDMILKKQVEIGDEETTGELWERLSVLGAEALVETLEQIEKGIANREKQGNDYSMAPMLDKLMSKIDWNKSVNDIKNLIRGLNPIMGTYSFVNGKKIKFWNSRTMSFEEFEKEYGKNILNMANGTVVLSDVKKGLFIKASDGVIKILEIQGENAKRMPIGDFLRGYKILNGDICE